MSDEEFEIKGKDVRLNAGSLLDPVKISIGTKYPPAIDQEWRSKLLNSGWTEWDGGIT